MPPSTDNRFELKLGEDGYPEQLALTPDPARVLYGVGDPGTLVRGLAVVGSRKATPYGLSAARMFAGWAAATGISIISGAAVGCDQAAHAAALAQGGKTVAVLGCGADIDYPRSASRLLQRLRSGESGCVVSEQAWRTPPFRWAFARRNRIIAGLAHALLVVEASLPSGTFSTADHAVEAGRDVLVVPGSIFSPESRGCNRLLSQGATPVSDVSELAFALSVTSVAEGTDSVVGSSPGGSDLVRRTLLANAMRPDDVARALGLSIVQVARAIGSLEAEGVIARYPDGRYGPCRVVRA